MQWHKVFFEMKVIWKTTIPKQKLQVVLWNLLRIINGPPTIKYNDSSFISLTVCDFSVGAFVICWTPGLVVLLLDGLNCTSCNVMKLKRWLLLLAVLNSVMNPCIYSYKDEEMWTTFKNLICCIGNGTRRQRSTKANSRPLSSNQDTGNSQHPSEETKNDDILNTWKWNSLSIYQNFCPALTGFTLQGYRLELTWKTNHIIVSSWSQGSRMELELWWDEEKWH